MKSSREHAQKTLDTISLLQTVILCENRLKETPRNDIVLPVCHGNECSGAFHEFLVGT